MALARRGGLRRACAAPRGRGTTLAIGPLGAGRYRRSARRLRGSITGRGTVDGGRVRPAGRRAALVRTATARVHIRTAALSARQTRGWCRYALRRSEAASFGRAVRWNTEAVGRGRARSRDEDVDGRRHRLRGQPRCEGTNEPVHSDISPLRCCYRNYLLRNK